MSAPTSIPFGADATMTRHAPQRRAEPHTFDLILDARDPMAIARRFISDKFTVDGQPALHRYREEFFKFSGSYRAVDSETMRAEIWSYLERAYKVEKDAYSPFKPKKGNVDNVVDALKGACNLDHDLETSAWLDNTQEHPPAAEFLPVANGLLHLPTGNLHPPSPLYFSIGGSGVTFDPNATPPNWLSFLTDTFANDEAKIALLQEWMGYCVSADTAQHKMMLLVGPSRSGKSTIAHILTALLGASKVGALNMSNLSEQFGLEGLIGKNLAISGDARIGSRADHNSISERLLGISGGDIQTIQRKHRLPWMGRLRARIMIVSNELPRFVDNSGALAKRFLVLLTARSFYGAEDHELEDRLVSELPGILNWTLEGYRRLRKRERFEQPESAIRAIQEVEELASPIKPFIADKCVVGGGEVKIDDLYRAWVEWCRDNGHEAGSKLTFGRNLKTAVPGIEQSQRRSENSRARLYVGIRLNFEHEP